MITAFKFLFVLFLKGVLCSILPEAVKEPSISNERLVEFMETLFTKCMDNSYFDDSKSICAEYVQESIKFTTDTAVSHYALFADGLYYYIDITCLKAIKLFKQDALDGVTKNQTLLKIQLAVNETKFFDIYNGNYKAPERSIMLMIKTVILLESNPKNALLLVRLLGELCISEKCQELVYDYALKYTVNSKPSIPALKINRNIPKTDNYDAFLEKCYDFNFGRGKIRESAAQELAVKIIEGPFSAVASSILLKIFKETQNVLLNLADDQSNATELANFIVRTGITDEAIPIISVGSEPNMIALTELVLKLSKDYAKIQNLMSFSTETMANSDIDKFLLDLTERDDLLMSYYKIDVQLVNNCVKKLFAEVPNIIKYIQLPSTSLENKRYFIKVIFIIFVHSPLMDFKGEITYDFEALLDIVLIPEIFAAVGSNVGYSHLGQILYPSISKIDKSHLKKYLVVLEKVNIHESLNTFMSSTVTMLVSRLEVEDIFWKSLDVIYEFYQENQFEIGQVMQALILTENVYLDARMTRRLAQFCSKRKIISKTFRMAANVISMKLKAIKPAY